MQAPSEAHDQPGRCHTPEAGAPNVRSILRNERGDEITYNPVAAWIVVEDQQGVSGSTVSIRVAPTGTDHRAATRKTS
jgi:hypothetical protein